MFSLAPLAPMAMPGVCCDACTNKAPARDWYPTAASTKPNRSANKLRLIVRLASPRLGRAPLSRARPSRTTNQPCQRLNSNTKNDSVVSDSPGPNPKALSAFLLKLPPMLLNVNTPKITIPSPVWVQKRIQAERRKPRASSWRSSRSAMRCRRSVVQTCHQPQIRAHRR